MGPSSPDVRPRRRPRRALWLLVAGSLATPHPTRLLAQAVSAAHAPFPAYESAPRRPLVMAPDGRTLYALNPADHRVEVFPTEADRRGRRRSLAQVFTGLEPVAMAFRDADTLLVANALSDSVAVVDLPTLAVTRVLEVGDEPTDVLVTGGRVFVTCARAPQDPTRALATDNPMVSGVLQVFDAGSLEFLRQVPLELVQPRAMATDGRHVFLTPQHAGSRTTSVPQDRLRPRRPPRNTASAEQQSRNPTLNSPLLAARDGAGWGRPRTGIILNEVDAGLPTQADRDVIAVDVETLAVAPEATIELGSSFFALELLGGRLWLAGIRGFNLGNSEPDLRGSAFDNLVYAVEAAPGGDAVQFQLDDPDTLESFALPVAIAGWREGARLRVFVAALGASAIVELDPDEGFVQAIPCEGLPMGLVADPERRRLYAWCRTGPEIVALDPDARRAATTDSAAASAMDPDEAPAWFEDWREPLSYDPEPPLFSTGRVHLYDARGDHGNGTFSCASCHQFADHDQLAWNLGDPGGGIAAPYAALLERSGTPVTDPSMPQVHPLKGPMMTQSLRGLDGVQPLHWRGDRRFVQSFRGAFGALQGGDGLPLREMQELATFLHALRFPPNPYQPRLHRDPLLERGEALFHGDGERMGCVECHRRFDGQGPGSPRAGRLFDLGTPQLLKAPDLRGAYTREAGRLLGFGPGHEGAARDLREFLDVHPPLPDGSLGTLSDADKDALAAFVRAFDSGEDPCVGWQRTVDASGVAALDAWLSDIVERRRTVRFEGEARFDVVLKLWQAPGAEGGLRVTASDDGDTDLASRSPLPVGAVLIDDPPTDDVTFLFDDGLRRRWAWVRERVETGSLRGFVLCVPAGTGDRLGIDRDEDGLFDALEARRLYTDPARADTDGDRLADGLEVLVLGTSPRRSDRPATRSLPQGVGNTRPPQVLSHRVHSVFASHATLEVVLDRPGIVLAQHGAGLRQLPLPQRLPGIRCHHEILLGPLPAGNEIEYRLEILDPAENRTPPEQEVRGSFRTRPAALHVDRVELTRQANTIVAQVRVVDQEENSVEGLPVQLVWHFASDTERNVADRLDRILTADTDAGGIAAIPLPATELPDGSVLVSVGVVGLGSTDADHRWFVGHAGDEPRFFYEQALNQANSATLMVEAEGDPSRDGR